MKRNELWDDAFKKINSIESAYWLGFVFGGVCMVNRGNRYAMIISSHRKTNVKSLSEYIEFEGNIIKKLRPIITVPITLI